MRKMLLMILFSQILWAQKTEFLNPFEENGLGFFTAGIISTAVISTAKYESFILSTEYLSKCQNISRTDFCDHTRDAVTNSVASMVFQVAAWAPMVLFFRADSECKKYVYGSAFATLTLVSSLLGSTVNIWIWTNWDKMPSLKMLSIFNGVLHLSALFIGGIGGIWNFHQNTRKESLREIEHVL